MKNIFILQFLLYSSASLAQLSIRDHGRIVDLNNVKIYYEEYVQGEPLFLLHVSNDKLRRIRARTLIVHGDNDFIPVSQAWEIYQNIPGARIWISPNTGHMPQYGSNNRTDFIRRTMDFLEGEGW